MSYFWEETIESFTYIIDELNWWLFNDCGIVWVSLIAFITFIIPFLIFLFKRLDEITLAEYQAEAQREREEIKKYGHVLKK